VGLAGYNIAHSPDLPPVGASVYEYWLAANGVFVRGRRAGVEAMIPVSSWCEVRGLAELDGYCYLDYPPLPKEAMRCMLELSRAARDESGPVEALFHIEWDAGRGQWELSEPKQERSATAVRPLETGPGSSYESALIEVHSHHTMQPFWSGTDNREEQGFRLYGVLGDIFGTPTLRLRVGLYGYFMPIPAWVAFDMPDEVADGIDERPERVRRAQSERGWVDIELTPIEAAAIDGFIDELTGLWVPAGGAKEHQVGSA
jgi:PRTRC genetic system protein A